MLKEAILNFRSFCLSRRSDRIYMDPCKECPASKLCFSCFINSSSRTSDFWVKEDGMRFNFPEGSFLFLDELFKVKSLHCRSASNCVGCRFFSNSKFLLYSDIDLLVTLLNNPKYRGYVYSLKSLIKEV